MQTNNSKSVALYYAILKDEGYQEASKNILKTLQLGLKQAPNQRRIFYLDIDGHKNPNGGFDDEMFKLQQDFMLGFAIKYLSEVHMPLGVFQNPNQINKLSI